MRSGAAPASATSAWALRCQPRVASGSERSATARSSAATASGDRPQALELVDRDQRDRHVRIGQRLERGFARPVRAARAERAQRLEAHDRRRCRAARWERCPCRPRSIRPPHRQPPHLRVGIVNGRRDQILVERVRAVSASSARRRMRSSCGEFQSGPRGRCDDRLRSHAMARLLGGRNSLCRRTSASRPRATPRRSVTFAPCADETSRIVVSARSTSAGALVGQPRDGFAQRSANARFVLDCQPRDERRLQL